MSTLMALAATASEAEPSKAPFYVVGGILVAWAVAVAAFGLARPAFPSTRAQFVMVAVISVGLVAATLSAVIITS